MQRPTSPLNPHNLTLRRHDDDSIPVYEGVERADLAGGRYVYNLKRALWWMGFYPFPTPEPPPEAAQLSGQFDLATEFAVREFQFYASGRGVAVATDDARTPDGRRALNLEGAEIPLEDRYVIDERPSGNRVTGVVNARTRELLELWLRRNWHCPVVIEGYVVEKDPKHQMARRPVRREGRSNLWLPHDLPSDQPGVFVKDFSKRYERTETRPGGTTLPLSHLQILGQYFEPKKSWPGGPGSWADFRQAWEEAEVTPASCGFEPDADYPERVSTFKVIRAVSEQECRGFFDGINNYDHEVTSVGLFHWTFGTSHPRERNQTGEFGGFLTFVEARKGAGAVRELFEGYGLAADRKWADAGGEEGSYNPGIRKANAWYVLDDEGGPEVVDPVYAEGNQFKNWHWFYRFAMAGRTNPTYRHR